MNPSSPPIKIVSIGGGTGLSRLLSGLKHFVGSTDSKPTPPAPSIEQLTAVVTVTDDGGSSGRLRQEFQILPPGDIITLGPGSLFTSLLPNLLVRGIPEAIARSRALKIYIGNIMTQGGETPGFTLADHLQAVCRHLGIFPFDVVLCNHSPVSDRQQAEYRQENAEPVRIDFDGLGRYGVRVLTRDLLARDKKVRHDPRKLALAIFDVRLALDRLQPPVPASASART